MFEDPLFLSVVLAAISTVCLVLFGLVDFKQWRALSKIEAKVEAFQAGDLGSQFGQWLLARPPEPDADGKPQDTNIEACATVLAHKLRESFIMAARGMASGESRTIKAVEKAIVEGIQTPETKALLEFVDRIGLDRELAGTVYEVLEKKGWLPQILKNNGQGASSNGWQI